MSDTVRERRGALESLPASEREALESEPDPRASLAGLALSGGGIRSATFALGVLQALGERRLLWVFDYLSTVSGGGYTGGWWSAWLSRPARTARDGLFPADERLEPDRFPATLLDRKNDPQQSARLNLPAETPDGSRSAWLNDPIHHLRLFSNYLTPRKGALSGDTWRAITVVSRNLVLTWLILLPLLLAAMLLAQLYFASNRATAYAFACSLPDSISTDTAWLAGRAPGTTVPWVGSSGHVRVVGTESCLNARQADAAWIDSVRVGAGLRPRGGSRVAGLDGAVADDAGFVPHAEVLRQRLDEILKPALAALLVVVALTVLWMLYGTGEVAPTLAGFATVIIGLVLTFAVSGPAGVHIDGSPRHWLEHFRASFWFRIGAGCALLVLLLGLWPPLRASLANARARGAAERVPRDRVRNTIVRWHARVLVGTVAGLTLLLVAGFGHELYWYLFDPAAGTVARATRVAGGWTALALSLGSGLFTVIRSGPTAKGKDAAIEKPTTVTRVVMAAAPVLVLAVLVVAAATLGRWLYATMPTWSPDTAPAWSLDTTPSAIESTRVVRAALVGTALLGVYALHEYWASATRGAAGAERWRPRVVIGLSVAVLLILAGTVVLADPAVANIARGLPLLDHVRSRADWGSDWSPAGPMAALALAGLLAALRLRTTMPDGRHASIMTRAFAAGPLRARAEGLQKQLGRARERRRELRREIGWLTNRVDWLRKHAEGPDPLQLYASGIEIAERKLRDARAKLEEAFAESTRVIAELRRTEVEAGRGRAWSLARLLAATLTAEMLVAVWLWPHLRGVSPGGAVADGMVPGLVIAGAFFCVTFLAADFALARSDSDRAVALVAMAALICGALLVLHHRPHDSGATALTILGVGLAGFLVGGVVGLGWMADPNLIALHNFYKARLVRAYLGASNATERRDVSITETAAHDDLRLAELGTHLRGGPVHVINTTLNLVGGRDLSTAQRYAAPFTMSSEVCGSARTGYHWTADYMGGTLSLGTAVATSGAAVSTNMGSKSVSSALALLLALFNVRLGLWAPTPNKGRWFEPQPRLWPFYLLREALSQTNDLGTYCYLTDGGHFDNTGLYALVERGCRYILVLDDGADVEPCFSDMGEAIRRCRIDFGAEIRFSDAVTQFVKARGDGLAEVHYARGTIEYAVPHLRMLGWTDEEIRSSAQGVIVWVKPVVTSLDTVDVRQYKLENAAFPQQTTADQWYDESQFESYRSLGYQALATRLDAMLGEPRGFPRDFEDVPDFFARL